MSDERRWIDRLLRVAESVEDGVDLVRYGIRGRLGGRRAIPGGNREFRSCPGRGCADREHSEAAHAVADATLE